MSVRRVAAFLGVLAVLALAGYGLQLIWRGFNTADEPSSVERIAARSARNLSIPAKAKKESNPFQPTRDNLKEARESFIARCSVCHGADGSGKTEVGRNLYPKVPDLRLPETQRSFRW